jgi:hypothetical protein
LIDFFLVLLDMGDIASIFSRWIIMELLVEKLNEDINFEMLINHIAQTHEAAERAGSCSTRCKGIENTDCGSCASGGQVT